MSLLTKEKFLKSSSVYFLNERATATKNKLPSDEDIARVNKKGKDGVATDPLELEEVGSGHNSDRIPNDPNQQAGLENNFNIDQQTAQMNADMDEALDLQEVLGVTEEGDSNKEQIEQTRKLMEDTNARMDALEGNLARKDEEIATLKQQLAQAKVANAETITPKDVAKAKVEIGKESTDKLREASKNPGFMAGVKKFFTKDIRNAPLAVKAFIAVVGVIAAAITISGAAASLPVVTPLLTAVVPGFAGGIAGMAPNLAGYALLIKSATAVIAAGAAVSLLPGQKNPKVEVASKPQTETQASSLTTDTNVPVQPTTAPSPEQSSPVTNETNASPEAEKDAKFIVEGLKNNPGNTAYFNYRDQPATISYNKYTKKFDVNVGGKNQSVDEELTMRAFASSDMDQQSRADLKNKIAGWNKTDTPNDSKNEQANDLPQIEGALPNAPKAVFKLPDGRIFKYPLSYKTDKDQAASAKIFTEVMQTRFTPTIRINPNNTTDVLKSFNNTEFPGFLGIERVQNSNQDQPSDKNAETAPKAESNESIGRLKQSFYNETYSKMGALEKAVEKSASKLSLEDIKPFSNDIKEVIGLGPDATDEQALEMLNVALAISGTDEARAINEEIKDRQPGLKNEIMAKANDKLGQKLTPNVLSTVDTKNLVVSIKAVAANSDIVRTYIDAKKVKDTTAEGLKVGDALATGGLSLLASPNAEQMMIAAGVGPEALALLTGDNKQAAISLLNGQNSTLTSEQRKLVNEAINKTLLNLGTETGVVLEPTVVETAQEVAEKEERVQETSDALLEKFKSYKPGDRITFVNKGGTGEVRTAIVTKEMTVDNDGYGGKSQYLEIGLDLPDGTVASGAKLRIEDLKSLDLAEESPTAEAEKQKETIPVGDITNEKLAEIVKNNGGMSPNINIKLKNGTTISNMNLYAKEFTSISYVTEPAKTYLNYIDPNEPQVSNGYGGVKDNIKRANMAELQYVEVVQ